MYVLSEFIWTMFLNPSFAELYVVDWQVFPAIEVSDPELQLVTPQKEAELKELAELERLENERRALGEVIAKLEKPIGKG